MKNSKLVLFMFLIVNRTKTSFFNEVICMRTPCSTYFIHYFDTLWTMRVNEFFFITSNVFWFIIITNFIHRFIN